ncbi:META domain-containing protein [Neisseria animaloris]|uniref:META domain-containing protein n=1 Tax=Neisseria animaloris TaxID=326522 RepID=UPI000D3D28A2|nr:META domain-containing protein [Neisseria animaloris]
MKTWIALSASTLVLMTGCFASPAKPQPEAVKPQAEQPVPSGVTLKRVWMLSGLEGFTRQQLVAARAEMDLRTLPRVNAYMGCNRLMLSAGSVTDEKISFGNVASTRMYCDKNMALEQAFAERIEGTFTYRIEGHKLVLRDASGREMHFVAQDWD